MDRILVILCVLVGFSTILLAFPEGIISITFTFILSTIVVFLIRYRSGDDAYYLTYLFVLALLARLLFGLFVHAFDLRKFFGGDALTYDYLGNRLVEIFYGQASSEDIFSQMALSMKGSGWGMNYLVSAIYFLLGRNILAAQSFCAVIGAATVPMVYTCAHQIFANRRVAKIAALLVALYPAFIIWSGQLMKDGLIIFLLVLSMSLVMRLQEKLNYASVFLLFMSIFGILSLRFYIFYMVVFAVVGAFVLGQSNSATAIMRRAIVMVALAMGMTYFGVLRNAGEEFDKYGSLERIQQSRRNLAESESGFGEDLDVSTTDGAIAAIPIGFVYLMLAPFPWQVSNLRQAITLPEILVWWASIPFLLAGLWYTVRHRLRNAIAILIFTLMLTLAYSIFQGNVGTAYRQRTQIQVFLFIFIGAGWVIRQEKRENEIGLVKIRQRRLRQI